MERLFVLIGRVTSVLLLLILLGAVAFVGWGYWSHTRWQNRGVVEVTTGKSATNATLLLEFGRPETISGTDTQMVELVAEGSSGKFSSSGYGRETRNILFLSGEGKQSHWLFPTQNNLILISSQLHEDAAKCQGQERPAKALYFEFVAADTNGDGKLSRDDLSSIALSKPDGSGFVEVLGKVDRVLSYNMLDGEHVAVIYQSNKAVRYAKFSVVSMAKEADQEIANIPEGV